MKTIMIPIYKQHNENIFDTLLKTEEIRKMHPKIELPFKAVVYEPKKHGGCGMVVGEFVVDEIGQYYPCYPKYDIDSQYSFLVQRNGYLTATEVQNYGKGKSLYGWHITAPKRYERPKELREFSRYGHMPLNGTYYCGNFKCKHYRGQVSHLEPPECLISGCFITHAPQNYMFIEEV